MGSRCLERNASADRFVSEIARLRLCYLMAAFMIGLHLLAARERGPQTWGFHHLGYLPWPWALFLGGVALLLVLPPVAGILAGRLDGTMARLGEPGQARTAAVLVIVISVACFWFGRVQEFFLSDSRLLIDGIDEAARHFAADTMAIRVHEIVHRWLAGFGSATASFRAVSMGSGLVWLAAMLGTVGAMTPDGRSRFLLGGLIVTAGLTKLFYGYPETSPLLAAAVALFILAGVRVVRGGGGEWWLAAAAVVASAMHVTGILVLPAVFVALKARLGMSARARLALIAAPIAVFAIYAAVWLTRPESTGVNPYGSYWEEFTPLAGPLHAKQAYTLFSWPHLVDIVNEMILLGPFVLAGWVAAVALIRRSGRRFLVEQPVAAFLVSLLVPFLLLSLLFHRKLGAARDWDLVATVAVPSILLFGFWLVGAAAREAGARRTQVGLALITASLLHLAGWVLVDAEAGRSLRRFETLADVGAPQSRFARSYALEEIGTTHIRAGRMPEATRAYEQAVAADPANAKAAASLGTLYGSAGRTEEAMALFRETVRLRPDLDLGHFNLANALARRNQYPEAELEYREALRLEPKNAMAWLYLGAVLRSQGRLDEARRAWREGLTVATPDVARRLNAAIAAPN